MKPHDLLKIQSANDLICYSPAPEWVSTSISHAPFVVVRRVRSTQGYVAAGIRGSTRSERFAAFLPIEKVMQQVKPEHLAQEEGWRKNPKEIYRYMEQVSDVMDRHSLEWGPVGSTGFELATEGDVTTKTSDIDVVIRFSESFTPPFARQIEAELKKLSVHIDVQVETVKGAFSLSEYAASEGRPLLFRTLDGPMLKKPIEIITAGNNI